MRFQRLIVVLLLAIAGCQSSASRAPTTSPFQSHTLVPPPPTGALNAPTAPQTQPGGSWAIGANDGVGPIGVNPPAGGQVQPAPTAPTNQQLLPPAGVVPRGARNVNPRIRPPLKLGEFRPAGMPNASRVISAGGPAAATTGRDVLPASHSGPTNLLRRSDNTWQPQGSSEPATETDATGDSPQPADPPAEDVSHRFGHADDYSWLRGRLEYSQIDRCWKLRYLPCDRATTDRYGGSVVLPDATKLAGCERGDFLEMTGRVGKKDPRTGGFSPIYYVGQLQVAAKAQR